MDVLERPRAASPASGSRRVAVRLVVLVLVAVVLSALTLVLFRVGRAGVLPGVEMAGSELGGLGQGEMEEVVRAHGESRGAREVVVARDDLEHRATAAEVGYRLDVEGTHDDIWERGRQANPVTALVDHVRASFGGVVAIEPRESVDTAALETWSDEAAEALAAEPVEAALAFDGAEVVRTDPETGAVVDAAALRADARDELLGDDEVALTAEFDVLEPVTTTADLEAVLPAAERAVSAPVVLSRGDTTLEVTPEEIGQILEVRTDVDAEPPLQVLTDAERFTEVISDERRSAFDRDPVNADIRLVSGEIQISESTDGFAFDEAAAAEQLLEIATGEGERSAELAGEVRAPARSTEDAQALGIVEPVSTFTTQHACCESRVTNIQRFADLVDGAVVEPGETFSLNDHVGERTEAKGFVGGGAILRGEFVEQIGGGVSQFATTFYNAAYFGGYAIPEHKAHSYYISRYPVGREATINYPTVDLKVRNNSDYGILIDTSYTSTSITVTFWGTTWVDVRSETGSRTNVRQPETQIKTNPELPAGAEVVTQEGREGFDITDVRVLTFPDGRVERESIFTRYLAEPRIIERGA